MNEEREGGGKAADVGGVDLIDLDFRAIMNEISRGLRSL